ncbi:MAG TPA: peptidoglycan bridge formation glycyltransferase FemA/FemB family protein, partial [Candidatus Nitrosocosmicus sp.]|nr:peptidoglycan bridge formation glycyltransferase FemA/FemB family protein [Candidatus Nitrosocosmicus sp.]
MTIQKLGDDVTIDEYNKHALHPLQSLEWGEARKKLGVEVVRFGEYEGEELVNVYQMTLHNLPYLPYRIGYIPKSNIPSKEVLDYLYNIGKEEKLIFIKFEPNAILVEGENVNNRVPIEIANIVPSSNPLFPKWTLQLNLQKSEDELLANMKPKTRYNIRLAQKKGVVVKEMTNDEGFEIYAKLYFETCARQKYHGHNLQYHRTIFENLRGNIAHLLIAFYEKTPLAAYELFLFNDVLYYPYGGSSLEYRNLMGANLLMWETIKFGKQRGAVTFDMWGSAAPGYAETDPWAGFTRIKEGYGSEFVEFVGSYDLVINKSL